MSAAKDGGPARVVARVSVNSSRPIFMEMDVSSFADIFIAAGDDEQVAILRACLLGVREAWPMQFDFIGFEMAKEENADLRRAMAYLLDPEFASLRAAREASP